jgi:uncharacterized protein YggE
VRPDTAYVSLAVVDERPLATDASGENARLTTLVLDGLKGSGVDAKDIATVGLSLAPVMSDQRDPKTNQIVKSVVTGYRASNILRIRLRDIDRAGALIGASVQNGALYQNIAFELSDREAHQDALRVKAVENAAHRAALYAEGAQMKLGALRSLAAGGSPAGGYSPMPRLMAAAAPGAATPIEAGMITLTEIVSATYDLTAP